MACLGETTYHFTEDKNIISFNVRIIAKLANSEDCSENLSWKAHCLNYKVKNLHGTSGEDLILFNEYMTDDTSRIKIYSIDNPQKYYYINLVRYDPVSDVIDEDGLDLNNYQITYTISANNETLSAVCCSDEYDVSVLAYAERIDLDKKQSGASEEEYYKKFGLANLIVPYSTNRNAFGYKEKDVEEGENPELVEFTFSGETNCTGYEMGDITNTINFLLSGNDDYYSSYEFVQHSPFISAETIAYSSVTKNNIVDSLTFDSEASNKTVFITSRKTYYCDTEYKNLIGRKCYEITPSIKGSLDEFNLNDNDDYEIEEAEYSIDGIKESGVTVIVSSTANESDNPRYSLLNVKSSMDDSITSIPLVQRGNGDDGKETYSLKIGFENEESLTNGDFSYGGKITYYVGSIGVTKTVEIGYIRQTDGSLTQHEPYITLNCIKNDLYSINIDVLYMHLDDADNKVTSVFGGPALVKANKGSGVAYDSTLVFYLTSVSNGETSINLLAKSFGTNGRISSNLTMTISENSN